MVKMRVPIRFIKQPVRKDTGTVAARGPRGRFKGRRGPESVPTKSNPYIYPYSGPGDTTKARHLIKNYDWNRDGKIGKDERGGTIHGRTVKVKASSRARGYERRV